MLSYNVGAASFPGHVKIVLPYIWVPGREAKPWRYKTYAGKHATGCNDRVTMSLLLVHTPSMLLVTRAITVNEFMLE